MKLNVFKRKLRCLIERIKLSESDYRQMKARAQMYNGMMSTVKYTLNYEYEDAIDKQDNILARFEKAKSMTLNINIVEMLAAGGVTFDKRAVKVNVTGF